MAFGKWNAVIQELREQRERSDREWALTRQELRVGRRVQEESLALCARLVERTEGVFQANIQALQSMAREIDENTQELRAQREAIFKVLDRMDGLDGGAQPA